VVTDRVIHTRAEAEAAVREAIADHLAAERQARRLAVLDRWRRIDAVRTEPRR
jgi:hypothetical protein